jgi:hypothetical protein
MRRGDAMSTELFNSDKAFDRKVEAFQSSRASVFAALIEELVPAVADPEHADFARVFHHAQLVLGKTDLQLSHLFKVSRPTVGRWARGITAPHPFLRKAVFETLLAEAKSALRIFRQAASAAH